MKESASHTFLSDQVDVQYPASQCSPWNLRPHSALNRRQALSVLVLHPEGEIEALGADCAEWDVSAIKTSNSRGRERGRESSDWRGFRLRSPRPSSHPIYSRHLSTLSLLQLRRDATRLQCVPDELNYLRVYVCMQMLCPHFLVDGDFQRNQVISCTVSSCGDSIRKYARDYR